MEEIFRVMQCTDAEKVTLAAYQFDGEAAQWWLGYRANMEANQRQLIWAHFKTLFLDKSFSSTLRDQKEVEFLSLCGKV
jgi:N-glycosylase/DNA lyase